MDDYVEYRAGFGTVLSLIVPSVFFLPVSAYLALSNQIHGNGQWIFLAIFDAVLLAMSGFGIAILLTSSLKFYSDGFSFQDIGFPTLRFRWEEIAAVTTQDVGDVTSGGRSYRTVVRLRDPAKYLESLSHGKRMALQKNNEWPEGGIAFGTSNIAISRLQLETEFKNRTDAPVAKLENFGPARHSSPAPSLAPPVKPFAIADASTETYRASPIKVIPIFLIGLALAAGAYGIGIDPKMAGLSLVYDILFYLTGTIFIVLGIRSLFILRLIFEPEGLLYRGRFGGAIRIPWEEVSGVHIATTRQSVIQGNIVVVELKDFQGFLRRQSPDLQKKIRGLSQFFGDGVSIELALFPLKGAAVANKILTRAGLK